MAVSQYSLLVLLILRETSSSLITQSIFTELVKPWDVKISSPEYIHMGLVMAGVSPEQHPEQHYLHRMEKMLRSTISYSQGTPLHLVFISDQESVQVISRRVESAYASMVMGRILLHNEIWKMKRYRIPKLRVEFVDLSAITDKYRDTVEHMKTHFNRFNESYRISESQDNWGFWPATKYDKDLFYLAPFYHLVFPFHKFIVVDADIEFKYRVESLYDVFESFEEEQMYSLGRDLSPFYRSMVYEYRAENPGTEVGSPGNLQGVNTGVVLLHLAKMRESLRFNKYLEKQEMDRVCQKFHFKGFIGDQDWWNLVVWDSPHLVHFLPCIYNYQTNTQLNKEPWTEVFPSYHHCEGEVRIMHGHDV